MSRARGQRSLSAAEVAHFEHEGYILVRGALNPREIAMLRVEAAALRRRPAPPGRIAPSEPLCALDMFRDVSIPEGSPSRTETRAYAALRRSALSLAGVAAPAAAEPIVMSTLASLCAQALRSTRAYLFNEQFIVKPQQSTVGYAWHADAPEQFGMFLDPEAAARDQPYVSAWVALDEMRGAQNGSLVLLPRGARPPESGIDHAASKTADTKSVTVSCDAGDAVIFSSRLWHCSGPNPSTSDRRVFYAQYSPDPIRGVGPAAGPLLFAVPCTPLPSRPKRPASSNATQRRAVKRPRPTTQQPSDKTDNKIVPRDVRPHTDRRCTVVINADDLGYSNETNRGIMSALSSGAATSASLMVNAPASSAAARTWRTAPARGAGLGIHLNLTEGKPITVPDKVPSLVVSGGQLRGKHGLSAAVRAGDLDMQHVEVEARAQIEWFIRNIGRAPGHLDGHNHAHVIPGIARIVANLCKEYGIQWVRCPQNPPAGLGPNHNPDSNSKKASWEADEKQSAFSRAVVAQAADARVVFSRAGLYTADVFLGLRGLPTALRFTDSAAAHATATATAGNTYGCVVEVMCHPGYPSTIGDPFARSEERLQELKLLQSEAHARERRGGVGYKLGYFPTVT